MPWRSSDIGFLAAWDIFAMSEDCKLKVWTFQPHADSASTVPDVHLRTQVIRSVQFWPCIKTWVEWHMCITPVPLMRHQTVSVTDDKAMHMILGHLAICFQRQGQDMTMTSTIGNAVFLITNDKPFFYGWRWMQAPKNSPCNHPCGNSRCWLQHCCATIGPLPRILHHHLLVCPAVLPITSNRQRGCLKALLFWCCLAVDSLVRDLDRECRIQNAANHLIVTAQNLHAKVICMHVEICWTFLATPEVRKLETKLVGWAYKMAIDSCTFDIWTPKMCSGTAAEIESSPHKLPAQNRRWGNPASDATLQQQLSLPQTICSWRKQRCRR